MRSDTARVSCGSGLLVRLRDSASGAWFRYLLSHSVVKLYPISLAFIRYNLGFSISSRQLLLWMGMSGCWSVMTWKCCRPARNILHLDITHVTANNSSSMMAKRDSVSQRNHEPACTGRHVSSCFCSSTKPSPCLLASVHNRVGLVRSK